MENLYQQLQWLVLICKIMSTIHQQNDFNEIGNCICGIMVSVLASRAVDHGFESQNVKLHLDNTIPIKHKLFYKGSSKNHQEPDRSNHTNYSIKILLGKISRKKNRKGGNGYGVYGHFQQYFSCILAISFIGGGNRSTLRKPPTCCK